MEINRLWTKLFTKNTDTEELRLTSAGAMVRHRNPFEDLVVPRNNEGLPKDLIEKYVAPYYIKIHSNIDQVTAEHLANSLKEINTDVVENLLGDFNWRTRLCGAYFAGVKNYQALQDIIGKHLLKSEVCYAGTGYCLALVSFNNQQSKEYLEKYLEYYLSRKDLWFDQADAYCALEYLDKDAVDRFTDRWNDFVSDKPNLNLDTVRRSFYDKITLLKKLGKAI